jgi:hypothetical protein
MSIDPNLDRREQTAPAWRRFHRRGDVIRNPIVLAVVAGLLINLIWAAGVYAWQEGIEASHKWWRDYGAGIAAEGNQTNSPDQLRKIIARVQAARSP